MSQPHDDQKIADVASHTARTNQLDPKDCLRVALELIHYACRYGAVSVRPEIYSSLREAVTDAS